VLHGAPNRLLDAVSWLSTPLIALKHATPAQVVREIAGGDTVKANHPGFQAAVVGINVLNVEGALSYPLTGTGVDDMVGNALGAGKVGIDRSTITTKHGFSIDQRQ
jgi:hypothetical protein